MKFKDFLAMSTEDKKILQQLDLSDNKLGYQTSTILLKISTGITKCESLQELNLSENDFCMLNDETFPIIFEVIPKCSALRRLNLNTNFFDEFVQTDRLKAIFKQVSQCKKLQSLDISNNGLRGLDKDVFSAIFDFISQCLNLQRLNLRESELNKWDEERFDILCNSVCKNPHLTEIQGIAELTDPIRKNRLQSILDTNRTSSTLTHLMTQLTLIKRDEDKDDKEKPSNNLLYQVKEALTPKDAEPTSDTVSPELNKIGKQEEGTLTKGLNM